MAKSRHSDFVFLLAMGLSMGLSDCIIQEPVLEISVLIKKMPCEIRAKELVGFPLSFVVAETSAVGSVGCGVGAVDCLCQQRMFLTHSFHTQTE